MSRRWSGRRIPSWDPRAVKAAIVGTASAGKVDPYDLRIAGAGLVQPRKAVDTVAFVYTDPGSSSLAFGFQEAGKVPGSSNAITETRTDDHPEHLQARPSGTT